jgi:hypothetical protein
MRKLIRKEVFLLFDKDSFEERSVIKYFGYFDIQEVTNYFKKRKKIFYYNTSDNFLGCEARYVMGRIL